MPRTQKLQVPSIQLERITVQRQPYLGLYNIRTTTGKSRDVSGPLTAVQLESFYAGMVVMLELHGHKEVLPPLATLMAQAVLTDMSSDVVDAQSIGRDRFPLRLRTCRRKLGLTQRQAATQIGCSRGLYGQWETGVRFPSQLLQPAVATFMGQSHEEFSRRFII